jgi:hypothetical protein
MQTISRYFVALLVSFFSNYVNESPSEPDRQAGIYETPIKQRKQTDCNSANTKITILENYI